MSTTQIDAAKFLLNKRIPNPPQDKNINHSGELSHSGTVKFVGASAPK